MSVTGVGSSYSYWYDPQTQKLSTKDGSKDAFVDYFNGELAEEEYGELNGYNAKMKGDIEAMIRLFSSGVSGANIFQSDDGLYDISAEIVNAEKAKYSVNGQHSFTGYAAIPYTKFHLEKRSEKQGDFSDLMEQDEDTRIDSESSQEAVQDCPVNDIYESMKQSGNNKTYTDIGIYNMSYDTTLYISNAGTLTCIAQERGYFVLWEIPITKDEEAKIDELIKKKMDFILRDKEIVEEYLKGNISIEDIEKWQEAQKNHTVSDGIFAEWPEDIRRIWEKIRETDASPKDSLGKDYLLTEMDKYLLMNLSNNGQIKDGSLEDIIEFVDNIISSLKDSLKLHSVSMQKSKIEELDIWEKFREELEQLK